MPMGECSNAIVVARHTGPNNKLELVRVEMLSDTGANYFAVNNPELPHDLVDSEDTIGVTGGSAARIDYKGTLCLCLMSVDNATRTLMKMKDVPYITLNLHSGLLLTPFVDFRFN